MIGDLIWALACGATFTVLGAVAVCVAACVPAKSRDRCD